MELLKTINQSGVTVIIVEDNMLVADSVRMLLETLECHVAGMAGTVERGIDLVESNEFDVALLDIDLRGRSVLPVVRAVQDKGKPFLFISGYGDETILPEELRSAQRLNKPLDAEGLVSAIQEVLANT